MGSGHAPPERPGSQAAGSAPGESSAHFWRSLSTPFYPFCLSAWETSPEQRSSYCSVLCTVEGRSSWVPGEPIATAGHQTQVIGPFSVTDPQTLSKTPTKQAWLILKLHFNAGNQPRNLSYATNYDTIPEGKKKKERKKVTNTLKLGLLQNLIRHSLFTIRSLKQNSVHILQLNRQVPQLLADLKFHMNLSYSGKEKESEQQMRGKYLG